MLSNEGPNDELLNDLSVIKENIVRPTQPFFKFQPIQPRQLLDFQEERMGQIITPDAPQAQEDEGEVDNTSE